MKVSCAVSLMDRKTLADSFLCGFMDTPSACTANMI